MVYEQFFESYNTDKAHQFNMMKTMQILGMW